MQDYLGTDRVESVEKLIDLDDDFYREQLDRSFKDSLSDFVSIGRFQGKQARRFDAASFLQKHTALQRLAAKDPKFVRAGAVDTDRFLRAFFTNHFPGDMPDLSGGQAEKKFWEIVRPELDTNTIATYAYHDKLSFLNAVAQSSVEDALSYFSENQNLSLLGSDAAKLLSQIALWQHMPVTAEYFILHYLYGTAWSYPCSLKTRYNAFPVYGLGDYCGTRRLTSEEITVTTQGEAGNPCELIQAYRLQNVRMMGDKSLVLTEDNIIIDDQLSLTSKFSLLKYPATEAGRLEKTHVSLVTDGNVAPEYFYTSIAPRLCAAQGLGHEGCSIVTGQNSPGYLLSALKDTNFDHSHIANAELIRVSELIGVASGSQQPDLQEEAAKFGAVTQKQALTLLGASSRIGGLWRRTCFVPSNVRRILNWQELSKHLEESGFDILQQEQLESTEFSEYLRESKYLLLEASKLPEVILMLPREIKIIAIINRGEAKQYGGLKQVLKHLSAEITFFELEGGGSSQQDIPLVSWGQMPAFKQLLQENVGTDVGRNAKFADLAQIYADSLSIIAKTQSPLHALSHAIKYAAELVRKTRDVGYMMIDPQYNNVVERVFSQAVSEILPARMEESTDQTPQKVCIFASQIYDNGGHTRLIEDILATQKDRFDISILLTNFNGSQPKLTRKEIKWPEAKVYTADSSSLVQTIKSVDSLFKKLDPDVIINMAHPHDAVAYGFMMRENQRRWLYGVHADHTFSFFPEHNVAEAIVFTDLAEEHLVEYGRTQYSRLPMTCLKSQDPSEIDVQSWGGTGLLTLSAGSEVKFLDNGSRRYIDLLDARFTRSDGIHIHVGPLSKNFNEKIRNHLDGIGCLDRFKHVEFVPSIADFIVETGVDLFITSYPTGGGKAVVEAMSVGCPVSCSDSGEGIECSELVYDGAFKWKNLQSFGQQIQSVDESQLSLQKNLSYEHFLEHRSPEMFGTALREAIIGVSKKDIRNN